MGRTNAHGNGTAKQSQHSRVQVSEFQMSCLKSPNFQIFILRQAEVIHFTYREFLSHNLKFQ
jgi:hypothetical protein